MMTTRVLTAKVLTARVLTAKVSTARVLSARRSMQMIFSNTRVVSNSYEFSLTLLSNSKACHRMQVKLERRPTMDILAPGNRGQRTQTQAHKSSNHHQTDPPTNKPTDRPTG